MRVRSHVASFEGADPGLAAGAPLHGSAERSAALVACRALPGLPSGITTVRTPS
jgi:hypothetical protein